MDWTGAFIDSPFREMAAVLAVATLGGMLGHLLRQPLIISFLVVGIIVGPSGLGLIESREQIEVLAHVGIALLLFIVGLRLDLHMIRSMGPVALATGLGQVLFTSVIGYLICLGLGMAPLTAGYLAVALTFSSTIIIVKLLSDKREIDALHGRIAIGFLIVQDVMAILALIVLSALGGGGGEKLDPGMVLGIILKGVAFLAVIALLMRYVLPLLCARLARYQELLVLFAIAWAVLLAAVGDWLGFSKEVGAFLAGVAVASTRYRDVIGNRLVTLRDFLLLFFFIDLGSRLEFGDIQGQFGTALILSLFVLVGNPLIVLAIMGAMGYRRRTGFLAGLTVAQISEFSLILGALGLAAGHIDSRALGLITLVGIITICASSYMILYSAPLYRRLEGLLKPFERRLPHREVVAQGADSQELDFILVGLGDYGGHLVGHLQERRRRILGVDFDPQVLADWRERGLEVAYGDAGDPEFLDQLPLGRARWVVSTIRDLTLDLTLIRLLKERSFSGRIGVAASNQGDAQRLVDAGADLVLRPFLDAAEQAVEALTEARYILPQDLDWPLEIAEVHLRPGTIFAGQTIAGLDLRNASGATILAVSRSGAAFFDPHPDFNLYPGDHLVLLGDADSVGQAQALLEQRDLAPGEGADGFAITEVMIQPGSRLDGQTLGQLRLRQEHHVTIVGIRRGDEHILSPNGEVQILPEDLLMVAGPRPAVDAFAAWLGR